MMGGYSTIAANNMSKNPCINKQDYATIF